MLPLQRALSGFARPLGRGVTQRSIDKTLAAAIRSQTRCFSNSQPTIAPRALRRSLQPQNIQRIQIRFESSSSKPTTPAPYRKSASRLLQLTQDAVPTQYALVFLPGVVIGRLFDIGILRIPLITSSILVVVSTLLVAECHKYWHFLLCQGFAVGVSLMFLSHREAR